VRKFFILMLLLGSAIAAWANSSPITFGNSGGKIFLKGSSLSLSNATLTSFSGLGFNVKGILGTVAFTTGALSSGQLASRGAFAAGGPFLITSNGSAGLPHGILFSGSFSGPVNWTGSFTQGPNGGRWTYTLSGHIQGKFYNGLAATGATVEFSFDLAKGFQFGIGHPARENTGTTTMTSVPEPSSLAMLGSGLFVVSALAGRKYPIL